MNKVYVLIANYRMTDLSGERVTISKYAFTTGTDAESDIARFKQSIIDNAAIYKPDPATIKVNVVALELLK